MFLFIIEFNIFFMEIDFAKSTLIRVRYGETDQMGYCYYGNYAQYFEVGRVEALRGFGLSYKDMEVRGVMLPVLDFQVKYIAPAFYDDLLTIVTKIVSLKGSRLYFEYEVLNEQNELLSVASTTLVFVSKGLMKPIHPPKDFLKIMEDHSVKLKNDE
jgi:acyl-CoA thioester hydrolase